ncbi:MAG: hypothetical protein FD167_1913 [bacterium]|nr:MAG: hypothetical protein FD167_1913 [bacterium]
MRNSSDKYILLNLNQNSSKQSYSKQAFSIQKKQFLKLATASFVTGVISLASLVLTTVLVRIRLVDFVGLSALICITSTVVGIVFGLFALYKSSDLDSFDIGVAKRKVKVGLLMNYISFIIFLVAIVFFISIIASGIC